MYMNSVQFYTARSFFIRHFAYCRILQGAGSLHHHFKTISMKIRLLLLALFPVLAWGQVFEKIDKSVTASNDVVYSSEEVLETQDGHLWFNSRFANRYRLFEYDGTAYIYHKTFYDSLTSQTSRDINATYFAQAADGTLFTSGGQNYSRGYWRRTPRDWQAIAASHSGVVYFYSRDSIIAYDNGSYTKYPVALLQIAGLANSPFSLNIEDYAVDNLNNLYVVNQDTGLVRINLSTQAVDYLPTNRVVSSLSLDRMKSVYVSTANVVYVGSWDSWFGYYDGTWHTFISTFDIANSFSRVNGFVEDSQQRVWLNAYSSFKGVFARFDPADTAQFAEYIIDTSSSRIFDNYPRGIEIVDDTLFYAGVYQRDYIVKMNKSGSSSGIGLNEAPVFEYCSVYPNPTTGALKVVGIERGTYVIHNTAGQKLGGGKLINGTIELSNLPQGVYILSINTEAGKLYRATCVKR